MVLYVIAVKNLLSAFIFKSVKERSPLLTACVSSSVRLFIFQQHISFELQINSFT